MNYCTCFIFHEHGLLFMLSERALLRLCMRYEYVLLLYVCSVCIASLRM